MNLGQFHDRVSAALKRGTSLDALIPFWVADSARLLEQNYTFSWMRRVATITFPAGVIPLSTTLDPLVKSINWVKPILDSQPDGTEWYGEELTGVDDRRVLGITGGNPEGYWLDGTDGTYALKLDAIPASEFKIKVSFNKFTDWPTADAATPTLLLRGQSALMFQTMIIAANEIKDARMADSYGTFFQGAIKVLLDSEVELEQRMQNNQKMEYSGLQ